MRSASRTVLAVAVLAAATLAANAVASPSPEREERDAYEGVWVLVGQGCGPDREIMVAWEEDEFPYPCAAIDVHWIEGTPRV